LIGFASIGIGTGLYTADVPFVILAAAFVPAVIALVVIAMQATAGAPAEENAIEVTHHGRARHRGSQQDR